LPLSEESRALSDVTTFNNRNQAMAQSSRFQKIVAEAKSKIREISPAEANERLPQGAMFVDVRESDDFAKEHAQGATHLSRGVIELKIEQVAPDTGKEIICYCGGGSRSALVAESLQRMGYTNVFSLAGGFKAWKEQSLPTD
jgi:phage shock protein E